ncbi:hypothetical protein C8A05DRAFT_19423 [Staphylotrichum tortipilum]|uniref:Flavin-containing monooxygenase n=1 Tax=Staphylotrichum tortipilum TaxID=2831512 RepID=A0AAN6RPQ1_9PEZI|nr:hypothetical protein C8A05DRAFT_19423 [Staphylotrichum longicolle]
MASESGTHNLLLHPFHILFQLFQWLVDKILSPNPPSPRTRPGRPRIAVIGAGITGVTSAAHCVGHGFDVTIFEAGGEDELGGIWSRVNNTSSLQIHSLMYRFHPSVRWEGGYPDRQQILTQLRELWRRYGLDSRTRFNTKVERVYQGDNGRWIVNEPSLGTFDGIIAAIGTCGEPKIPRMPGMDKFQGVIHHSSRLTGACSARDKTVIIIGGGASAVEALEFAHHSGAKKVHILARSDKWIIPRNALCDMLLALNVFGQETRLSWIPELLLRKLFYRDLEDLAPARKGLFTDTPMVNSEIMEELRSNKAEWVRCDIEQFAESGVQINRREKGVAAGGPGRKEVVEGDVVVMATGFARPKLDFLPATCFTKPYGPPNWYLQTFPPSHPSISCINCTYMNAIGTVGNWHIGIYTRILLMFLVDPLTRPSSFWMKKWIDMTRLLKVASPTGPFEFFTYLELVWWFAFCVTFNPFRWKWAFFVFFGLGFMLPKQVVAAEDRVRNGLGVDKGEASGRDVGSSC